MDVLTNLYLDHPFWVWLAVGAVFLAVEIATGTSYLLWPAASAAVVALLPLFGLKLGLPVELAIFAGLTIVSTLTAHRYLPRNLHANDPDINDPHLRLAGKRGVATAAFVDGQGRVDVDGKDWAAVLDGGGALAAGAPVEVASIDGARLKVRAA
ncbi:MAG: NfeD family protein [Caulobacteraceae bacterium]